MAFFQFLGTGPSVPITDASGRNRRLRSSALMRHIASWILIDATHDFLEQSERALSITALLLTHASRTAAGGLGNLDRWLESPIPFYATETLWGIINDRQGPFENLEYQPIKAYEPFVNNDLEITCFKVETSQAESAGPTYGYQFNTGKKRITYAPNVKFIPEASAPFFENTDLLIVDAAGWNKDLPTHRGALNHLATYAETGNEKILFTNIGRATPPHTQASATVRRLSPKADLAYDFLKFPLGR